MAQKTLAIDPTRSRTFALLGILSLMKGDHAAGVLQVAGIQVGHLGLGDLLDLLVRDAAHFGFVGYGRAGRNAGGLLQEHGGRRTFVSTNAGFRLELHPPRDWLDDLLASSSDLQLAELHLRADDPELKASTLGELLGAPYTADTVMVGETVVRFVPDGPQGRPQLHAELFV